MLTGSFAWGFELGLVHHAWVWSLSAWLLRGLRQTGEFLALGGDAFQKLGSGFVVRVLRDELAGEGVAENGLAQRLRAL